jgi:hypothetical protein
MLFERITSILRINGGEIFQQERVDKVHQENRRRDSRSTQETGCLWMERESSYNECDDSNVWGARAPLAVTK